MNEAIVLALLLVIVLTAAYFYVQRRKQQGAFGGQGSKPANEHTEDRSQ